MWERLLDHTHCAHRRYWHGREVSAVLLSGNHEKIDGWRREQSLQRTRERRPDLRGSESGGAVTCR